MMSIVPKKEHTPKAYSVSSLLPLSATGRPTGGGPPRHRRGAAPGSRCGERSMRPSSSRTWPASSAPTYRAPSSASGASRAATRSTSPSPRAARPSPSRSRRRAGSATATSPACGSSRPRPPTSGPGSWPPTAKRPYPWARTCSRSPSACCCLKSKKLREEVECFEKTRRRV